MDILIIAHFCNDFSSKDNGRFLYLAKLLSQNHDVEIITSQFWHETKAKRPLNLVEWSFKIIQLEEPGYYKNVCLKRFYSHFAWGRNLIKYLNKRTKPDVIYCAVPSLTGPYCIAKYCEKNSIRFIVDIQDLWPEAFRMAFNVPVFNSLIFFPFTLLANGIYKRADVLCAVSETYVERALRVNKESKKGTTVFLGTELATFDENVKNNPVEKGNELWLGYCGTLGASYDLTVVIDALAILKKKGVCAPKFIVMGSGERKEEFESHAVDMGVDCLFTGSLPYNKMCGCLKACDIVVNPIVGKSAASIINKHGDYAASGLPVLNTQESEEYRNLVDEYKMGFNCRNGDSEDLAEKISLLVDDEQLRKEMGANARRCAEERFDRHYTYSKLVNAILGN